MSHSDTHGYTLNTETGAVPVLVGQHHNTSICILTLLRTKAQYKRQFGPK